jgi:hypothetical protein
MQRDDGHVRCPLPDERVSVLGRSWYTNDLHPAVIAG